MSQTDIDTVIPTPHVVTLSNGEQVEIKAVKVGKLPKLLLACRPLYDDLKAMLDKSRREAQEAAQEAALATTGGDDTLILDFTQAGVGTTRGPVAPKIPVSMQNAKAPDVYGFVTTHLDSVLDVTALLLGKPRQWVDDLEINEMIELFVALVEVNLDFFIQRLLPLLSEVVKELVVPYLARVQAARSGQIPSTDLSDQVTDTPT